MLIVLDGMFGSGTGKLARHILRYSIMRGMKTLLWHRDIPTRHPLIDYELDLEMCYTPDDLFILDRWHLSDFVHGKLYRDSDLLDYSGAWHIDSMMQKLGAVQLILLPSVDVIRQNYPGYKKEGAYHLSTHGDEIRESYQQVAKKLSIPILTDSVYDEADVSVLFSTACARAERSNPLLPYRTYVGPRYPDLLLVAENRQTAGQHSAAFVPYPKTDGKWLCDTVVGIQTLTDKSVGLAYTSEDLGSLIDVLGQPAVVALGSEADMLMRNGDIGIPYGSVCHPSDARSKMDYTMFDYAEDILSAMHEVKL